MHIQIYNQLNFVAYKEIEFINKKNRMCKFLLIFLSMNRTKEVKIFMSRDFEPTFVFCSSFFLLYNYTVLLYLSYKLASRDTLHLNK